MTETPELPDSPADSWRKLANDQRQSMMEGNWGLRVREFDRRGLTLTAVDLAAEDEHPAINGTYGESIARMLREQLGADSAADHVLSLEAGNAMMSKQLDDLAAEDERPALDEVLAIGLTAITHERTLTDNGSIAPHYPAGALVRSVVDALIESGYVRLAAEDEHPATPEHPFAHIYDDIAWHKARRQAMHADLYAEFEGQPETIRQLLPEG